MIISHPFLKGKTITFGYSSFPDAVRLRNLLG